MQNNPLPRYKVEIERKKLPPQTDVRPKPHSATLLISVIRGRARVTLGQTECILRAGHHLWLPSDLELGLQTDSGIEFWHLRLRDGLWASQIDADREMTEAMSLMDQKSRNLQAPFTLTQKSRNQLTQTFESMHQLTAKRSQSFLMSRLKAHAITLVSTLSSDKRVQRIALDEPESIVIAYAKKRLAPALVMMDRTHRPFNQTCSIADLAKACKLGESRFHALFIQATGTTPNRYFTAKRIGIACNDLNRTDRKIIDIAYEVGFDSLSRFYAAFRQVTGTTPGKWRKIHQPTV